MTLLKQMMDVCDFVQKEICDKITLYVPPEGDVIDDAYIANPTKDHPEIFPLTFDSNVGEGEYDENGDPVSVIRKQAPAICIRIMEGSELLVSEDRSITVNLLLQSWNPGTFTKDGLYIPHEDKTKVANLAYKGDTNAEYVRSFEGWKESMTFLDLAISAIEKAEFIGNMSIVRDEPITFGPWTYEGEFIRWYPYWLSTLTFKLNTRKKQNTVSEDMLNF